jgi:hypothetical protein
VDAMRAKSAMLVALGIAVAACAGARPPVASSVISNHAELDADAEASSSWCSVVARAIDASPGGFAAIRGTPIDAPNGELGASWTSNLFPPIGTATVTVDLWSAWQVRIEQDQADSRVESNAAIADTVRACPGLAGWTRGEYNDLALGELQVVFYDDGNHPALQVVHCDEGEACNP